MFSVLSDAVRSRVMLQCPRQPPHAPVDAVIDVVEDLDRLEDRIADRAALGRPRIEVPEHQVGGPPIATAEHPVLFGIHHHHQPRGRQQLPVQPTGPVVGKVDPTLPRRPERFLRRSAVLLQKAGRPDGHMVTDTPPTRDLRVRAPANVSVAQEE